MTTKLQRGERLPLSRLTPAKTLSLRAHLPMPVAPDLSLFGLDESRRLTDDRYFIFYNQLQSPEGALTLNEQTQAFSIDLDRIPLGLHRLMLAATSDDQVFSTLGRGHISVQAAGQEQLRFEIDGSMHTSRRFHLPTWSMSRWYRRGR